MEFPVSIFREQDQSIEDKPRIILEGLSVAFSGVHWGIADRKKRVSVTSNLVGTCPNEAWRFLASLGKALPECDLDGDFEHFTVICSRCLVV